MTIKKVIPTPTICVYLQEIPYARFNLYIQMQFYEKQILSEISGKLRNIKITCFKNILLK